MTAKVLIRFNTRNDNDNPAAWRVLIPIVDEHCPLSAEPRFETYFADNVILEVPSQSSEDDIGNGVIKWHITAFGQVDWQGSDCYIRPVIDQIKTGL